MIGATGIQEANLLGHFWSETQTQICWKSSDAGATVFLVGNLFNLFGFFCWFGGIESAGLVYQGGSLVENPLIGVVSRHLRLEQLDRAKSPMLGLINSHRLD